ncbi:Probable enoyl-CoA hydratase echA8 [Bordetella parapertussis]|nr:enoyl-CoA hydratase/isomerase family protein [Bordetella parapertussis]AOB37944.1 enoyl-CoA hydratase [Bordetella parapertussis]AUL41916.1 enoyl-CoA hydratase [Bordetella parapertussis]MEB2657334.1 enoyl-CoA hydratase/isomerase family protein [Bordetella parapertussis]MEB2664404.1 enoyl-CoA hydratase/isomerase family protein [Bordetella parapertussis]MEB2666480.1 enoyl-CoA hydratase/isomerase family protein [Bordetella parapertussis]
MRYEDFEFLLCEPQDDGVMLVTLNRPDAMNATNDRMHWELTRIWGVVNDDPGVKAVVVTGAGERAFSAGGDLSVVEAMSNSHETTMRVMKEASDIVYNMLACDKPIISAINGTAVGAGLAVALLADVSVMAEDAKLTDGHARLGVSAGDHAAIIWPILCGMSKAKYYLMTTDFVDGKEAERIGLVTFCAPRAEVLPKSLAIAAKLARGSQTAIRATKKSLNNWMRTAGPAFDNSLALEMLCFLGPDVKEGLAALRDKRAPDFPSARLP